MCGAIAAGGCRHCTLQGQQVVHVRRVYGKGGSSLGQIRSRDVAIRATEPSAETPSLKVSEVDVSESVNVEQEPEPIKFDSGDIVRVDREKYYASVEALAVDHPGNYAGLNYIFEDRGEILEVRDFSTGTHAYIAWAGIPTAPAWLSTDLLIKADKLLYKRV